MITVLSSPKPGSGTSTTAALLALSASTGAPTTLVDLCGDQPAIFNCGAADDPTYLNDRLTVLDASERPLRQQLEAIHAIDRDNHVVIDAGTATHPIIGQLPAGTVSRWVIRPCYLALRRAGLSAVRPDDVIMLNELGRSLTADDVRQVLGAPVVATIDVHPEIARLVDAGLLSGRPPHHVLRHLTALLCPEESTQP